MSSKKLAEEVSKRIFAGCAGRINNKNPLLRKPLSKQTHITSYVLRLSLVDVDAFSICIIYLIFVLCFECGTDLCVCLRDGVCVECVRLIFSVVATCRTLRWHKTSIRSCYISYDAYELFVCVECMTQLNFCECV